MSRELDYIGRPADGDGVFWDHAIRKWRARQPPAGSGTVASVVAGDNVTVDNTDPANPVVSANSGASSTGIVWVDSDGTIDEEATAAHVATFAITAADTLANTFTVAGDHLLDLGAGVPLTVSGSTGNDGNYTSAGVVLVAGDTLVTVQEAVVDATADGTITTTTGRYDWSVTIPAGAWVLAVYGFPITAAWAADVAVLNAADATGIYIANGDLTATAAFDPYSLTPGDGYIGNNGLSWLDDNGNLSTDLAWHPGSGAPLPFGRYYEAGGTITVRITTSIASPPVVPTGSTKLRLAYLLPSLQAPAAPVIA